MEEPQPQPETCEAGYRVKKISIRRGYVIDQIKFQYDDHKIWSVGVDGGRKDNRDLIMTPGEYLVRVTHETLRQRSVSSLTFHPEAVCSLQVVRRGLSGVRDQQGASCQFPAFPGWHLGRGRHHTESGAGPGDPAAEDQVRLQIADCVSEMSQDCPCRHGKLENIVQQTVPTMEVSGPAKHWFAQVTPAGEITEFDDDKSARVFSQNKPGILLDVKRNKIIRNASSNELTQV